MHVLDENIPLEQRELLRAWGIHCRVIGQDLAQLSIGDDNIITLLHQLKQPTLFTRDRDFFQRELCHRSYALAWLDAAPEEAAMFVRRYLRLHVSEPGPLAWASWHACITTAFNSGRGIVRRWSERVGRRSRTPIRPVTAMGAAASDNGVAVETAQP